MNSQQAPNAGPAYRYRQAPPLTPVAGCSAQSTPASADSLGAPIAEWRVALEGTEGAAAGLPHK